MEQAADPLDRRQFARLLVAGIGGTAAGASIATAADSEDAATPPPSLEALLLAQIVTQCPGPQWDETMLQDVLNDLRGDLARGRQLSAFGLQNSDEMALIFLAPPEVASQLKTPGA